MESGPCSKYLSVLIDLGILKKETAITEKPGKKTIYLIEDNFSERQNLSIFDLCSLFGKDIISFPLPSWYNQYVQFTLT